MNPEPPLPLPDTFESNTEIAWTFWDSACAEMDDMGDWALSHPIVNTRGAAPTESHGYTSSVGLSVGGHAMEGYSK